MWYLERIIDSAFIERLYVQRPAQTHTRSQVGRYRGDVVQPYMDRSYTRSCVSYNDPRYSASPTREDLDLWSDGSPRGMFPRLISALSVRLRVSYVPGCEARFSIRGICRPVPRSVGRRGPCKRKGFDRQMVAEERLDVSKRYGNTEKVVACSSPRNSSSRSFKAFRCCIPTITNQAPSSSLSLIFRLCTDRLALGHDLRKT